jgi:formylglycine-generating enzyme required for sulfatase activity
MEVHYCDNCGGRIPESDFLLGLAFNQAGRLLCPLCWREMQETSRRKIRCRTTSKGDPPLSPEMDVRADVQGSADSTKTSLLASIAWETEVDAAAEQKWVHVAKGDAAPASTSTCCAQPGLRRRRARRLTVLVGLACAAVAATTYTALAPPPAVMMRHDPSRRRPPDDARQDEVMTPRQPPSRKARADASRAVAALERIQTLLGEGNIIRAESALVALRADLRGTPQEGRAQQIVAEAKARSRLARFRALVEEGSRREALLLAREALDEDAASGPARELRKLADELSIALEEERLASVARAKEQHRKQALEAQRRATWGEYRAIIARARSCADAGDLDGALALVTEAISTLNTERTRAETDLLKFTWYVNRARELVKTGEFDVAIDYFELGLRHHGDTSVEAELGTVRKLRGAAVLCDEAELDMARGAWAAAEQKFRRAADAATAGDVHERARRGADAARLSALREEARQHLAGGRLREAQETANQCMAMAPRDPAARELVRAAREKLCPSRESNSIGMRMLLVPGAELHVRSVGGQAGTTRSVRIDGYYIAATETTNAQFELFRPLNAKRRPRISQGDHHPVVNVTYDDAVAFCTWLSEREGLTYRLPTEIEWEYAARGRDGRRYPWGMQPPGERGTYRCNFTMHTRGGSDRDGFRYAAPVESFAEWPSPFGCLNMAGNVAEWCRDWYRPVRRKKERDGASPASAPATRRAVRGGSWQSDARGVRATRRGGRRPDAASPTMGFRVVREISVPDEPDDE